jgi:hypothetical protein
MGKFIAFALLICILLGAVFAMVEALLASPSFMFALIAVTVPFALLVILGVIFTAVMVARYAAMSLVDVRRKNTFVLPDENGLLPVAERLLADPVFAMRALEVHHAKAQQVPSSFHYSVKGGPAAEVLALPEATQAAIQPETFWQLWQAKKLPDNGFLLGYSLEDGQPVTANWLDLYSTLVGGNSGSGKSTMTRSLLAQVAMQQGQFVVVDPHCWAGEESLSYSLAPLSSHMPIAMPTNESEMVDALNYVYEFANRRLAGDDQSRTPFVLVVDELPALMDSDIADTLTRTLRKVVREARKVGVYALCCGQQFHSDFFPTTVRNGFVSFFGYQMRTDDARMMAGSTVHRLAVPNCTMQDLDLVASHVFTPKAGAQLSKNATTPVISGSGSGSGSGSTIGSGSGSDRLADTYLERHFPKSRTATELVAELENEERTSRAISMFLSGTSNTEIVATLWDAKTGDKKMRALQELNSILRSHMLKLGSN